MLQIQSDRFRVINKADGQLVMTFEQQPKAWLIKVQDERLAKYIFNKFPVDYLGCRNREYDELQIVDMIYTIKNKFRKFTIDFGEIR